MRFAINHITAPKLSLQEFFAAAKSLGFSEVEMRNDLPDVVGTIKPETVKAEAEKSGLTIISINALYPFNVWSGELPSKAVALADYAAASGAKALVMCPLNDGTKVLFNDLVAALKAMKPILDTFHHHLAGETEFFPDRTGLVHISGVVEPAVAVDDMLDAHRVLVDAKDRLENLPQIKALIAAGFDGPYSFEPFAEEVHALADPESAVRESMTYISNKL